MAARRQREANAEKREAEEEVIDTDHPISSGLPAGLHNVLNEISKAFAQNSIALPTLPSLQPSNSNATPRPECMVSQSQHHSSELRRQSDAQFLLSSTSDSFPERAHKDVSNAHEHYIMEEATKIEMQEASLDEDRLVHETVAKRGGRRDIQCEDLGKGLNHVQVERIREQDRRDSREKLQQKNAEIGDERKVVESRGGGDGACLGKGVGGLRQVLQTSSKSVLKVRGVPLLAFSFFFNSTRLLVFSSSLDSFLHFDSHRTNVQHLQKVCEKGRLLDERDCVKAWCLLS
jgi:hypothetical protein